HERLGPGRDRGGQRGVHRLRREILPAGGKGPPPPPPPRHPISPRAPQPGGPRLPRGHHPPPPGPPPDRRGSPPPRPPPPREGPLAVDPRELGQVRRKHDADHRRVCTSTESTGGRSRTMGAQRSPASADAYTCPPVVPKYTPHGSSASTAIASRSTFT